MTEIYVAPCGAEFAIDPCYECGCAPAIDTRSCGYRCGQATKCQVSAVLDRWKCPHSDCEHHPAATRLR